MSDKSDQEKPERDDDTVARLMRLAGPRSVIPPDIEARVYDEVRQSWLAGTQMPDGERVYSRVHREWRKRQRPYWRHGWAVALAASVLVALFISTRPDTIVQPTSSPIGTVARVVAGAAGDTLPMVGSRINAGDRLQTGPGQGISLLLARNDSLRLDANTTLIANAKDRFTLLAGRVYADSGDFGFRDGGMVIDTVFGSVADVGTQFAVAIGEDELGADELDVAVREGRVDIKAGSQAYVAKAGQRLTLTEDEQAVIRGLSPHDEYWDWAARLAPSFEIDNKSLLDFLRWVSRESGRELVFADSELRMAAMRTELHGSVSGIAPLEAMQAIVPTTRFEVRVDTDKIVVER